MVAKKKTPNFLSGLKEGTLHTALGYKQSEPIPASALNAVTNADVGETVSINGKKRKITAGLKKKAQFAQNAKKWKH